MHFIILLLKKYVSIKSFYQAMEMDLLKSDVDHTESIPP